MSYTWYIDIIYNDDWVEVELHAQKKVFIIYMVIRTLCHYRI